MIIESTSHAESVVGSHVALPPTSDSAMDIISCRDSRGAARTDFAVVPLDLAGALTLADELSAKCPEPDIESYRKYRVGHCAGVRVNSLARFGLRLVH